MDTYQDLAQTDPQEAQDASFATIAAIYDDGVTLKFDGMGAPTEKRWYRSRTRTACPWA